MERHESIVIGGGISGLACARRLHEAGREFLLVAERLGGRMEHDGATGINLGAGIVLSNYEHVLKYVGTRKRLFAGKHCFCDEECIPLSRVLLENLKSLPKIAKLLFLVWRFTRRFERMRKRLPFESFKEAIGKDELLLEAFSTPAGEFIRKHGLEELDEWLINPIIASTFYVDSGKTNAFYYLGTLTPLFSRVYIPDFTDALERLTNGFEKRILLDRVLKVTRKKGAFTVRTAKGTFIARNVVFAAPERSLRGIYPLPRPRIQQQVHRFIVRGKRKEKYRAGTIVFNPRRYDIVKISEEYGHDLVTSNRAEPDFARYYESHEVVRHVHWNPATIVPGEAIDQDLGGGAYLASDCNLCSLEYSFLSGLYAANKIIEDSA